MADDTWSRIETVLSEALDLPPEERPAFLDAACADDEVRREVESLLEADAHVAAEGFLKDPAPAGEQLLEWVSAQAAEAPITTGQTVGAYRVVRPLGRGGMGAVYLAERADGTFDRRVALKVIKRGMDTDEVLRRFHDERQILATLDHPNIAQLFDGGVTDDGLPYFVMEYVEGQPIDAYCDAHRLSIEDRLRLFQTVCDAVQFAHQNLVVHRDLKPGNVLVTDGAASDAAERASEPAQVKLLDFGIAKVLDPESGPTFTVTQTTRRRLTPEYAAPEQVVGDRITTAADVYALGVILYELLTGHRPYRFDSRRVTDIEDTICEHVPDRPSTVASRTRTHEGATITPATVSQQRATAPEQLRRTLSGDLDAITMKALRKEPEQRYATAAEFKADIENYLQGRPVTAQPSTFWYRTSRLIRRHKVPVLAACITALALIGGAGVALWQASVAQQEAERANQEAETATAALDALVTMLTEVDPVNEQGVTFTARDLVDAGLDELPDLEEQPRAHATMMNVLGRVSLGVGFTDLADSLHRRALAVQRSALDAAHPDQAESLVRLGRVQTERGAYDEAAATYRRALEVNPEHADAWGNLGLVMLYQGRIDAAIEHVRTAVEHDPENVRLLNNLGALYQYAGQREAAQRAFERSVALDPSYGALSNLATLTYYDNDYAEAARLYERALALNDEAYALWGYLGAAYYWSGQRQAADSSYRRAITLAEAYRANTNPNDGALHAELASYHAMLGHDADRVLPFARRALEFNPDDGAVLYTVAHAYEQIGRREAALDVLQQALDAGYPLFFIEREPGFQDLRADPRYQEIVEQTTAS
ncbi:MAG: protein kinase [Bacteroidetes bacterium]|jgi:serine/threonine-protein kinase|nr:protein kinase [Bacteroidota bacterium]